MSDKKKLQFIFSVFFIGLAIVIFLPAIPQPISYHNFANKQVIFSISNAHDVLSNLFYLITGIAGLCITLLREDLPAKSSWLTFFVGVVLVAPGSAYYHLNPTSETLVWDRLPMTIAFMGLTAAIICSFSFAQMEKALLPSSITAGILSIIYWVVVDDLKYYVLIQTAPILMVLISLFIFSGKGFKKKYLFLALSFYILAKIFEHYDFQIYALTQRAISGHTLKHIASAFSPFFIMLFVRRKEIHQLG